MTDRHPNPGVLRRLLDEPDAVEAAQQAHYDRCDRCRRTLSEIAATSRRAAGMLVTVGQDASGATPSDAMGQLRCRLAERPQHRLSIPTRWGAFGPPRRRRGTVLAATAAIAAVVMGGLGAAGSGLFDVFVPQRITPVEIAPSELRGLPDLTAFGRETLTGNPLPRRVASAPEAASASGLPVPSISLPPTITERSPALFVVDRFGGSFTFDAARARNTLTSPSGALPPMPPSLDGSTVTVSIGPAVVEVYGGAVNSLYGTAAGGKAPDRTDSLPQLVIGMVRAPTVAVSGSGLHQMVNYLLSLPGISPTLAAQIRAIGDPASALPIPIPLGTGHAVSINGSSGIAVGDGTGVGSAVVWEHDGTVRAAAGTLTQEDLLGIASSLH
ncbi:MAG: hypothetical protein ABR564_00885 [Candidatus Dormibacteria bacterium]